MLTGFYYEPGHLIQKVKSCSRQLMIYRCLLNLKIFIKINLRTNNAKSRNSIPIRMNGGKKYKKAIPSIFF